MYIRCAKCHAVAWFDRQGVVAGSPLRCKACGCQQTPREWNAKLGEEHGGTVGFAKEHRIDLPSANSVLLGLMTLEQALAVPNDLRVPSGTHKALAPQPRRRGSRRALVTGAALLLVAAGISYVATNAWNRHATPAPPTRVPAKPSTVGRAAAVTGPARVERDPSGQIVRISAGSPRAVLLSFCEVDREVPHCDPIELLPSRPARPDARLGVFRDDDAEHPDARGAIFIGRDSGTRLWVAGDGKRPIPTRTSKATATDGDLSSAAASYAAGLD